MRGLCWTLVVVVAGLAASDVARAEDVAGSKQAAIITRALAYDRNMKDRAGDAVVVGVLVKAGAEDNAKEMIDAFKGLEKFAVHGLPFRVVRLDYSNPQALRDAVKDQGIDALYVTAALEGEVENVSWVTRERKVITIGSKPSQVQKGLTLGVFIVDGKQQILINVGASKQEGAAFSSDLIRLAKVIE